MKNMLKSCNNLLVISQMYHFKTIAAVPCSSVTASHWAKEVSTGLLFTASKQQKGTVNKKVIY